MGDSLYKTKKGLDFFFYIVCFAAWGETVNLHETKEADKAELMDQRRATNETKIKLTYCKASLAILDSHLHSHHVTGDRGILPLN